MRHRLIVDDEDWSDRLISCTVSFRADAGSSGMEFNVTGSTEDYTDAPVRFSLGEDRVKEYFRGRLQAPDDDEKLDRSTAKVYGPFRIMAEQQLGKNETFVGNTLEYVILECSKRAGHDNGDIIVHKGDKYVVQQGEQFPFDNKMGEVIKSLMDKANFVGVDQPGGFREFMPKPRPGVNKEYKSILNTDDYITFELKPKDELAYYKVVVYRNGDDGKPVVYAEREIDAPVRIQPPKNRWFVVSDFAGEQEDAGDECFKLAEELRGGQKNFTIETFFDRKLQLYDGFLTVRYRAGEDRTYVCYVDDGIDVNYSPGSPALMTVTGSAHELKYQRKKVLLTPQRIVRSQSVLSRP